MVLSHPHKRGTLMIDVSKSVQIDPAILDHFSRLGCSDPFLLRLQKKELVVVDARAKHVYVRDPEDKNGVVHLVAKKYLKFD